MSPESTASETPLGYAPDHAVPPGDLLQEYLDVLGISARELGRRCGRSGKLMAEIASGRAALEPETALQFERVLNVPASIWSNMEAAYQLHVARTAEHKALADHHAWAKSFPLKELAERGLVRRVSDKADQVLELLHFFGVGSAKACEDRIGELLAVDFRTSTAFDNDIPALAAWLRVGERQAEKVAAAEFDREAFLAALSTIRLLTAVPLNEVLPEITEKCAAAGVVFILEKPFDKVRASGVSRWLSPKKALIQQSLRHKTDDHFWFTFFHECAHLLLHSRREVFIDMMKGSGTAGPKEEAEANLWAADFLIPSQVMRGFMMNFRGTREEVVAFARDQGIAPGIVVGQLQHQKALPFSALNKLKVSYEWAEG
jgi:HTH-type transcriptional regulator/antitoxin HigA